MKIPAAYMPLTPYKRKFSLSSLEVPKIEIVKLIGEGSFYKIYLTTRNTVLRVSKSRINSTDEIKILKCLNHPFINKMNQWWIEDSFLYFEMEKCDFSLKDRERKIEKFFRKNKGGGTKFKKILREENRSLEEDLAIQNTKKTDHIDLDKLINNESSNSATQNLGNFSRRRVGRRILNRKEIEIKTDEILNSKEVTEQEDEKKVIVKRIRKQIDSLGDSLDLTMSISSKRCLSLPKHSIDLSMEEIDGCLDGELITDGSRLVPLTSVFPNTELFPVESTGSIFDPFSESFVCCNSSVVVSESLTPDTNQDYDIQTLDVPKWITIMMYQISTALSYIHSKNIIHMDVKPENILVQMNSSEISFLLADFNISKFGEGKFNLDGDKMYMAPEILNNKCYFKSDVYALGLIYLELSGMCDLPSSGEKYSQLRKNDFKGWKIDEITRKMLEMDPEIRCSAQEVSDYFLKILNG